jgi:integrase
VTLASRLRHTWATELLNCGIGLPALMKLMGTKVSK